MKKLLAATALVFISSNLLAADNIGYGYIEGIKMGNFNEDQMSILLEEGYSHDQRDCYGNIFIRADDMSQLRFETIRELVISAHQNHYKIRFHSHFEEDAGCRATFVMIGEDLW